MVVSLGAGTHVFQLDRGLGEFVLSRQRIRMPSRGESKGQTNDFYGHLPFCFPVVVLLDSTVERLRPSTCKKFSFEASKIRFLLHG